MATWPADNEAALIAFYGTPKSAKLEAQLVDVKPPFQMYYQKMPIKTIKFHKKCAFALKAALQEIWDKCDHDQKKVDAIFASIYDGAYNPRKISGSTRWSNHAFAAAIDINADHNGFNTGHGNMSSIVIAAFKRQGARWGGDYHGRTDPMHFEFCGGGKIIQPSDDLIATTQPVEPIQPTTVATMQPAEKQDMDFLALAQFLPYIMQAISIGGKVITALNSGTSITGLLEQEAPDVLKLLKSIGVDNWGHLSADDQVQAAAQQVYDKATIEKVQTQLNTIGQQPPLIVDGAIGAKTKAAVTAFQKDHGLADVDGYPGPLTQAALAVASVAPAASPAVSEAINAVTTNGNGQHA